MKNWVAIMGDFKTCDNDIVFQGGEVIPPNAFEGQSPMGKSGILLFNDVLSAGEIELDIEFEKQEMSEEAAIVFNFQNPYNFMCVGVSNKDPKYEYKVFSGNWNRINYSGILQSFFELKYHIKLEIVGSIVKLYIDGVNVLSSISPMPIQKTNIGLLAVSKGTIKFSNYEVRYNLPKVFVISQFGASYDDLYNDVIKSVCENYNLVAERGDEMTTSTLILNDIVESIKNASLIIADISPNNPNVFYEVGYAHAINKPTILLCDKQKREHLPFDVSGFRTIFYDDSIGGKKNVEQKLTQYIKDIVGGLVIT